MFFEENEASVGTFGKLPRPLLKFIGEQNVWSIHFLITRLLGTHKLSR